MYSNTSHYTHTLWMGACGQELHAHLYYRARRCAAFRRFEELWPGLLWLLEPFQRCTCLVWFAIFTCNDLKFAMSFYTSMFTDLVLVDIINYEELFIFCVCKSNQSQSMDMLWWVKDRWKLNLFFLSQHYYFQNFWFVY